MRQISIAVTPFAPPAGDSLQAEHAMILEWVDKALQSLGEHSYYIDVDLKTQPAGQAILNANPDQGRRIVLAALKQVRHWDEQAERIRSQGENEIERGNAPNLPGWRDAWGPRRQTAAVIHALMRRALPFERDDLLALMQWCCNEGQLSKFHYPIGSIVRSVQRYVSASAELTPEFRQTLHRFATQLRSSHDKAINRFGTVVEQLDRSGGTKPDADDESTARMKPSPKPAPAGDARVLSQLKSHLNVVAPTAETPATTTLEPDRFVMRLDSPLQDEHRVLSDAFGEVVGTASYSAPPLMGLRVAKAIDRMDDQARGRLLLAAIERAAAAQIAPSDFGDSRIRQSHYAARAIVSQAAALQHVLDRAGCFDYLLYMASCVAGHSLFAYGKVAEQCLARIERDAVESPLTEGERYVLHLLRVFMIKGPPFNKQTDDVVRLNKLIEDNAIFFLTPGEAWSDALNDDLGQMSLKRQNAWIELLRHLLNATSTRPSARWKKSAEGLLTAIGKEQVIESLQRWLPFVSKGRSIRRSGVYVGDTRGQADTLDEENAIVLRGMLWLIPMLGAPQALVRLVTGVALSAYKKVPGVGPRAVKVGNAAVYGLSEMASPDAVGQLALLKVRVKFGTAQKEIEKAFTTAANALGLPRDQIEEMGVPSYGMEEVGRRREQFCDGEFTAEMRVDGKDVALHWLRADGKPQKSIPAKVKSAHKEEIKELQTAAKDVAAMLTAQAERLDSMFLLGKAWDYPVWRERYLDHPLIGTLARRLIWTFNGKPGIWVEEKIVDFNDEPLDIPADAKIALWHPIDQPLDDVLAWRAWLEDHRVRQPFKQAHREVYVLTEAERRTNTYSNRFAAHILRQHQFNALCAARGWKNKLRLMVDDSYPPASRQLPTFGLRAEFWIEGIGDNYGADTTDSGAYHRVSTDQVRFYRTGAADNYAHADGGGYTANAAGPGEREINQPISLSDVPALALSEILRDVDLFVGVASVGNDPTWQDGGPEGRYQNYWHSYSFGDLTETARTRKAVLERLVPRLKIASRCSLNDKYLIVRGDIRTYKIHLGSGNTLMEPNDQYLCIVPVRSASTTAAEGVFLPFEGDSTLSVILSKAFLLADDKKIKDETITRQIGGRSPVLIEREVVATARKKPSRSDGPERSI